MRAGVLGVLTILTVLGAACARPATPHPGPEVADDPGTRARDAVLARYDAHPTSSVHPWRPFGEQRVGHHAVAVPSRNLPQITVTPVPPRTPPPLPTVDSLSETQPAPAPTGDAAWSPRYLLPPHTDGVLRTNPRYLPALPIGTELVGLASWYGPGFHGLRTACGGIYDQNGATLATRELRCGTVVRITGPTGLTVQATVTDWGPAEWTGRRFDLSASVFNAIAPLGAGVVGVRVVTASVPG